MSESPQLSPDISPERYVEKVSLATGEPIDEPILPKHLLVSNHRDYHVIDGSVRHLMSRVVQATGDEDEARRRVKRMRAWGHRTSKRLAKMIGEKDSERVSKRLFGLKEKHYYFRYKKHQLSREEIDRRLEQMRADAGRQLERAADGQGMGQRVLLTGGTGFVGKEIMWQAATDPDVAEMVVLIRPKEVRDRKTGELLEVISPERRGEKLLEQLWLVGSERDKFRFVAGDVEAPMLGISGEDLETLESTITHVVHCAASVSFDDPYEKSFVANVTGTLNALRFSNHLQTAGDSPFVAHIGIETSYIHGRQTRQVAREDEILFPHNFYNNYYELTKAMASIETERFMLEKGLRIVQLCPAIVIGESRAGNNRGDTKVVNAPVNVFGRAGQALNKQADGQGKNKSRWIDRSKAAAIAKLACVFPGDPSAQINLIPVDRVVNGIVASLKRPHAIGERVHLATDNRVTSEQIRDIVGEEIGVEIKLAEPTIHRTVTLPLLTKVLKRLQQERIARALDKLGTIFGGYSEWGQPIHQVGNDYRVLGLPEKRPNSQHCFRMLCRHNRYVQEFGQVRDLDEISRREKIWWDFIMALEDETGENVGAMPAPEFKKAVESRLDLQTFTHL